ncbi:Uncharacterised protein [Mycobacterium tuberculosis]|nr:Uncharacterised protein [Mycobacterium tuberculosis]
MGNHNANADAACLPSGARSGSFCEGIWNTTVGSAGTIPRRQSSHCCCTSSGVQKMPIDACMLGSLSAS